jgi:hypothetical protein
MAATISTRRSSTEMSTCTSGYFCKNRSMIGGSMSTMTAPGTLSFSRPLTSCRELATSCSAMRASLNSGDSLAANTRPASVGRMLRVVRTSKGTPRRVSSAASLSLTVDGDSPMRFAAERNPPASVTARKTADSSKESSMLLLGISHGLVQSRVPGLPHGSPVHVDLRACPPPAIRGSAEVSIEERPCSLFRYRTALARPVPRDRPAVCRASPGSSRTSAEAGRMHLRPAR